jgi:tRNA U34 5-methylaminomethyl-2-thiouridine-forming methyltransferase MnmC
MLLHSSQKNKAIIVSREIIITKDGSHSLLHTELNETYHSVHGAVQESKHVFIEHGLRYWLHNNANQDLKILEIGFGTGLNALLTLQLSNQLRTKISYESLEAFPLSGDVWSKLNYAETLGDPELFQKMHELPWDREYQITDTFLLKKSYSTLQDIKLLPEAFDLIYYDAFAPAKQPEMWTLNVLGKVIHSLRSGGVFVTYCAKGQLKRDLSTLGLAVETLAGPPGKKEMVRASKR